MTTTIREKAPFVWILAACAFFSGDVLAEQPAGKKLPSSISIGIPMKGSLSQGEVLPKRGSGYVMTAETRKRRARFAVKELINLVKEAAFKVQRKHNGSLLRVADLSSRTGGRIDHHGSHQNGRDVDLLFYLLDKQGRPVSTELFIPIDANGYSTDPPLEYRFDVKRNWALIEALLRSRKAVVQWIFISKHIKSLLIEHAKTIKASPKIIRKASQVLSQPGRKTHMDHFHVRIYCPSGDKPQCRDVGPRWAWTR
ncbi:MAG: hypothetical protein GY854_18435 [Deltaproteobacteria bacterium]|nr:hypothetical protein [Deltaproteobacteria bacterium]